MSGVGAAGLPVRPQYQGGHGMSTLSVQTQAQPQVGIYGAYPQTVDRQQHTHQHHQHQSHHHHQQQPHAQYQQQQQPHAYSTAHSYSSASQTYDHLPVLHAHTPAHSSSPTSYPGSGTGLGTQSSTSSNSHNPHPYHHPQPYTSYSSAPPNHQHHHTSHSHSPHSQHSQDGSSSSGYRNPAPTTSQSHFHSQSTGISAVAGPSSGSSMHVGDVNSAYGVYPSPSSATASSSSSRTQQASEDYSRRTHFGDYASFPGQHGHGHNANANDMLEGQGRGIRDAQTATATPANGVSQGQNPHSASSHPHYQHSHSHAQSQAPSYQHQPQQQHPSSSQHQSSSHGHGQYQVHATYQYGEGGNGGGSGASQYVLQHGHSHAREHHTDRSENIPRGGDMPGYTHQHPHTHPHTLPPSHSQPPHPDSHNTPYSSYHGSSEFMHHSTAKHAPLHLHPHVHHQPSPSTFAYPETPLPPLTPNSASVPTPIHGQTHLSQPQPTSSQPISQTVLPPLSATVPESVLSMHGYRQTNAGTATGETNRGYGLRGVGVNMGPPLTPVSAGLGGTSSMLALSLGGGIESPVTSASIPMPTPTASSYPMMPGSSTPGAGRVPGYMTPSTSSQAPTPPPAPSQTATAVSLNAQAQRAQVQAPVSASRPASSQMHRTMHPQPVAPLAVIPPALNDGSLEFNGESNSLPKHIRASNAAAASAEMDPYASLFLQQQIGQQKWDVFVSRPCERRFSGPKQQQMMRKRAAARAAAAGLGTVTGVGIGCETMPLPLSAGGANANGSGALVVSGLDEGEPPLPPAMMERVNSASAIEFLVKVEVVKEVLRGYVPHPYNPYKSIIHTFPGCPTGKVTLTRATVLTLSGWSNTQFSYWARRSEAVAVLAAHDKRLSAVARILMRSLENENFGWFGDGVPSFLKGASQGADSETDPEGDIVLSRVTGKGLDVIIEEVKQRTGLSQFLRGKHCSLDPFGVMPSSTSGTSDAALTNNTDELVASTSTITFPDTSLQVGRGAIGGQEDSWQVVSARPPVVIQQDFGPSALESSSVPTFQAEMYVHSPPCAPPPQHGSSAGRVKRKAKAIPGASGPPGGAGQPLDDTSAPGTPSRPHTSNSDASSLKVADTAPAQSDSSTVLLDDQQFSGRSGKKRVAVTVTTKRRSGVAPAFARDFVPTGVVADPVAENARREMMHYPLSDSRSEFQVQPHAQSSFHNQSQVAPQVQGDNDVGVHPEPDVGASYGEDGVKRKATALADLLDSGASGTSIPSERWKRMRHVPNEADDSSGPSVIHNPPTQFNMLPGIPTSGDYHYSGGHDRS